MDVRDFSTIGVQLRNGEGIILVPTKISSSKEKFIIDCEGETSNRNLVEELLNWCKEVEENKDNVSQSLKTNITLHNKRVLVVASGCYPTEINSFNCVDTSLTVTSSYFFRAKFMVEKVTQYKDCCS